MIKKLIYLFTVSIFLFMGCKKSDDTNASQSEPAELKLEIKGISGWGNFVNISIDQNKTDVKYLIGGDGVNPDLKNKSYKTSENTLKQFLNFIKMYHLMDAKIEECASCADGTDYVIKINYEGKENTVTIAAHRTDGKYADLLNFINQM